MENDQFRHYIKSYRLAADDFAAWLEASISIRSWNHDAYSRPMNESGTKSTTVRAAPRALRRGGLSRGGKDTSAEKFPAVSGNPDAEQIHGFRSDIPAVSWTVDAHGRLCSIGSNVEQLIGYSSEELVGSRGVAYFACVHRDDRARVRKAYRSQFRNGRLLDMDYRLQHRDGRWIWLHARALRTYTRQGVRFADGVLTDVSRQRWAEKALRESEHRFRQIFTCSPFGIGLVDVNHRFIKVNPALCAILGYSEKELLRMSPDDLMPSQDARRISQNVRRRSRPGFTGYQTECRHFRKDGGVIWVRLTVVPVRDEEGVTRLGLGMVEDITQRRTAEERLRLAHAELEQRVRERTADLRAANRKLVEQIKTRRKIEQELRRSEASYRRLFQQSVHGIAVFVPGRIVQVNRALSRILKLPAQKIIGMNPFDLVAPEDRPRQKQAMRRAEQGRIINPRIFRVLRGDGTTAWVEAGGRSIAWQGQTAFQAIIRDVNQRKMAELALHRREMILEALGLAAERFLKTGDWRTNVPAVLARLGRAAEVDRAYIFENRANADGRVSARRRYSWTVKGMGVSRERPFPTEYPWHSRCLAPLAAELARGHVVHRVVRNLSRGAREALAARGVRALLLAPIFVERRWWGVFALEDCQTEREWTKPEIDGLGAAADALGAAIARQRTELAVRKSEKKLRIILNSLPDHASIMDKDLNIIWANRIAKRRFGGNLVGRKCYEAYHGGQVPCKPYPCLTLKAFRDGKTHTHETQVLDKKGKIRTFHCIANVVTRDERGKPTAVIEVSRDLTERIDAEQAIRAANERFALAADSAGIGVWELDVQRDKLIWDDRMFALYSRDRRDFSGKYEDWLNCLHPEDRERAITEFRQAVRGDRRYDTQFRVLGPQGEIRYIKAFARVTRNATGKPFRMTGVNLDVTQRVNAEEQARIRGEELAHLSRLATMGEMAAGLAHEINQPLSAIVLFAQGYLRRHHGAGGHVRTEARKLVEKIARQAQRAAAVVERLRAFTRKGGLHPAALDLNDVIRESLTFTDHDFRRYDIRLVLELAENLPPAAADQRQILQVLLNLIRNGIEALQAAESSPATLNISTARIENDRLLCTISDTGAGCDDHAFERLFEPFFTTKPDGSGLGLPISRRIIEAHGGRLWAVRRPGGGMTFHFTLPVARNRALK